MKSQRRHRMARRLLQCICIMAGIAAMAYVRVCAGSAPNIRTDGSVHISVEEQEMRQTPEAAETVCYLKPGQELEKKSRIYVEKNSETAYLRVKVCFLGITAAQQRDILETAETGTAWDYQKEDGYFYCRFPVADGESVLFPVKFCVPAEWTNLRENLQFCVTVMVEAAEEKSLRLTTARGRVLGWQFF